VIDTLSVPENVVSTRFTVARTVAPMSMSRGCSDGRPERCSSVILSMSDFSRWISERTTRSAGVMTSTGNRLA